MMSEKESVNKHVKRSIDLLTDCRDHHMETVGYLDESISMLKSIYLSNRINPKIAIGDSIRFSKNMGRTWSIEVVKMYGHCNLSGIEKTKESELCYITDEGSEVTIDDMPEKVG